MVGIFFPDWGMEVKGQTQTPLADSTHRRQLRTRVHIPSEDADV